MNVIRPSLPRRAGRNLGFTLIELMIAMILGLVVIAGVTSVFLAGQQSFRTNNALANVEDGSRIAFELMARDIREAGQTGCDSSSNRVANVLSNSPNNGGGAASPSNWWADWGNAIHGYPDSNGNDPALTVGTAAGNQVSGTHSLHILSGGNLAASVVPNPGSSTQNAANITLNQASSELQAGDVIIVCSYTGTVPHATILQITDFKQGNTIVVHNTGAGVAVPGNCSKGLGYPTTCDGANGNQYMFPPNSLIAKFAAVDWYIGYNGNGNGRSLYRMVLQNSSSGSNKPSVTSTSQEMVRNVTGMSITYLQPPNTNFVTAANVTDWSVVSAARVTLTLESTFQRATVDAKPVVRQYSATTTIRNRVD